MMSSKPFWPTNREWPPAFRSLRSNGMMILVPTARRLVNKSASLARSRCLRIRQWLKARDRKSGSSRCRSLSALAWAMAIRFRTRLDEAVESALSLRTVLSALILGGLCELDVDTLLGMTDRPDLGMAQTDQL